MRILAAHHGWELILEIPDRAYQIIAEAAKNDASLLPTMEALRGWPDLWFGSRHHNENMFIELKKSTGRVADHQLLKHEQLISVGLVGGVWRPEERDELEAVFIEGLGALDE